MAASNTSYEIFGAKLVQYFLRYAPQAKDYLCLTDCEPLGMPEVMALCPGLEENLKCDRIDYLTRPWGEELKKKISQSYRNVSAEQISLGSGGGHVLLSLMQTMLKAGDKVITHFPCFPPLYSIPRYLGCEVLPWRADPDQGWRLDLDFLADHLDSQTRMVVVNFPHNPSGYLPSPQEWQDLIEIVRRKGIYLLCDEVYQLLGTADGRPVLPSVADTYERGISVGSFSKAFALPGIRMGWMATGRDVVLPQLPAHDHSQNLMGHIMACSVMEYRDPILARNKKILAENRFVLADFLKQHEGLISCYLPDAGPVAFPSLAEGKSAERLCEEFLKATGILLVPGTALDFDDRHLRLGFGRRNFQAGLEKLGRFLKS